MEYEHSQQMAVEFYSTQCEMRRPFFLIRAEMHNRGKDYFEAKYGGVSGFGKTPAAAAIAFDLVWFYGSIEHAAVNSK